MFFKPINYSKLSFRAQDHHRRFKQFIDAMPHKLVCQDCGGSGGETVRILDDGTGPFEECGWCEGTGFVTPHVRSRWLNMHKQIT